MNWLLELEILAVMLTDTLIDFKGLMEDLVLAKK